MQLKVMTFNIRHAKGTDKKVDLHRIAHVIQKSKADIIGLNEVDHYFRRSDYQDQTNWLANHLNMHYLFSPSLCLKPNGGSQYHQYGNALLSHFPISQSQTYLFSGLIEGRSLLEATLDINHKKITVYVTHLTLNPYLHRKQTQFVIDQAKSNNNPAIIMGDWNMKPRSKAWTRMQEHFTDVWTFSKKKQGFTYPSSFPRLRLDYIFVNKHVDIISTEIITSLPEASDHLPVMATLQI